MDLTQIGVSPHTHTMERSGLDLIAAVAAGRLTQSPSSLPRSRLRYGGLLPVCKRCVQFFEFHIRSKNTLRRQGRRMLRFQLCISLAGMQPQLVGRGRGKNSKYTSTAMYGEGCCVCEAMSLVAADAACEDTREQWPAVSFQPLHLQEPAGVHFMDF